MRTGRLDKRIIIQRKTVTQDNSGEPIETWDDLATRWATVTPLTGTERLGGEALVAKEQVQFRIRWDESLVDLSPLDRIIFPIVDSPTDFEMYNIVQASPVGRREGFLILAYRFTNAG